MLRDGSPSVLEALDLARTLERCAPRTGTSLTFVTPSMERARSERDLGVAEKLAQSTVLALRLALS